MSQGTKGKKATEGLSTVKTIGISEAEAQVAALQLRLAAEDNETLGIGLRTRFIELARDLQSASTQVKREELMIQAMAVVGANR